MHSARIRPRKLGLRQKHGRRVGYGLEAALGHGKDTELVHRTETVLDGTNNPKAGLRIPLEIKHSVDHVLQ